MSSLKIWPLSGESYEKLEKHVRIVEDSNDVIRFIEGVITPARIIAVNKIWLPDGSEEMRIILDDRRSLKVGVNSLVKVVEEVKGIKLSVDFERRWKARSRRVRKRISQV